MVSAQESDLAPVFGDCSQSEKMSEIKPPSVRIMRYEERIMGGWVDSRIETSLKISVQHARSTIALDCNFVLGPQIFRASPIH